MSKYGGPQPEVFSSGLGLRVIDYPVIELEQQEAVTGATVTLSTAQLQQGQILRVERIVVTGSSAALTTIGVYEGDDVQRAVRIRDWTPFPSGAIAVAEYPSYLTIRTLLSIAINGANSGDIFQAVIQAQLCLKVPGQKWSGG